MSKIILLLFFLNSLCVQAVFSQNQTNTGELVLTISQFRNTDGYLLISLFNTAKDFPENKKGAFRVKKVKVSAASEQLVFPDLPYGEYAVIFMHDENDNEKMDTNFVGMPLEGYGASNDAVNTLSAPKYNEAKFLLDASSLKQTLKIFY